MTFDEWFAEVFQVSASVPEDFQHHNCGGPDSFLHSQPAIAVGYVIDLFENAERHMAELTDAHAAEGLSYLANSRDAGHIRAIRDVPSDLAVRCIESIGALFEQFFSKRCREYLGRMDEVGSALDGICYMWWDVFPIWPHDNELHFLPTVLFEAMRRSLQTDSLTCQESALLGLLQYGRFFPSHARALVVDYIEQLPASHPLQSDACLVRDWVERIG